MKCVKFAVYEEYFIFINQFINDSMFITFHSDIQNIITNIIKEMHNG